jgi:TolB-like protein
MTRDSGFVRGIVVRLIAIPLILIAAAAPAWSQQASGAQTTIAFLGFNAKDIPASGADILADLVRNELSISPQYTVIDRESTQALLEEAELQLSGLVDPESVVDVGRMLGVRKLMVGTIGELGQLYVITMRIIDVQTGEIERVVTEEFVGVMEDLRRPVRVAVQKLLEIEGIEVDRGTYVHVSSEPEGVGIYIDGLFEGNAPALVAVPGPGEYGVKLYSPGYQEWHQKVTVGDNSTFFVNARMLAADPDSQVDERVRALQDGRTSFIVGMTLYSALVTEGLIFASGTENGRLYFGMPLLVTPATFFLALRATDGAIMNKGRSFMITSSILWGSTLGFTSGVVLNAGRPDLGADDWRPYVLASVVGGLSYGTVATVLTRGDAFPARRAWFMNLGSFMGSLIGLGVPYMFNVESSGFYLGSMLAGSTAGGGLALYLTRHIASEGANVENL